MSKNVAARIVLTKNGELHLYLVNGKTVYATPSNVMELFMDPYGFIEKGYREHSESTRYINPRRKSIDMLPGLTMASVHEDTSIHVVFPLLFRMLFESMEVIKNSQLNIKGAVNRNEFLDQKEVLLKLFLDYANVPIYDATVFRKIPFDLKGYEEIIQEFFLNQINSIQTDKAEVSTSKPGAKEETNMDRIRSEQVNSEYVTKEEFAQIHNVSTGTVYQWFKRNRLHDVIIGSDGRMLVNRNEPYPMNLKTGRKENFKENGQLRVSLKGDSYEDLQQYMKDRNLFTESVRPYIRSYDEVQYYEKHYYREVKWNGRSCLIIDINPFYFSKKYQKTNRQLIEEGKSPVVPDMENYCFVLHHIGQLNESPFAIIHGKDHEEYYSIFHQGNTGDSIRRNEFEVEKKVFWRTYLLEFDKAGMNYKQIPAINSKDIRQRTRKGSYNYDQSK